MKLRFSVTSPFARKVLIVAIETGLDARIERVPTNAWDPATDLVRDNPLSKVPALVLDGGETLYDSPVICEYLDSLHDGTPLLPPAGGARWAHKRLEALADGLMDAAVAIRVELSQRPEDKRWQPWVERQTRAIERALDAFEEAAANWGDAFGLGQVAVVCALGYLDFRFASLDWRAGRPRLAAWAAAHATRPSVAATRPVE